MKAVFIAHPLGLDGPDRVENIKRASKWVAWAGRLGVCPMASWIILAGQWPETEDNRAAGLAINFEQIERSNEVWLCGLRISPGMTTEADYAKSLHTPVLEVPYMIEGMPT